MSVIHQKATCSKSVVLDSVIQLLEEVWVHGKQAATLTSLALAVLREVRRLGIAMLGQIQVRDAQAIIICNITISAEDRSTYAELGW